MGQSLIDFFNYYASTPVSQMGEDAFGIPELIANAAGGSVNPKVTPDEREDFQQNFRSDPDAVRFREEVTALFSDKPLRKSSVTGEMVSLRQSIEDDYRSKYPQMPEWWQVERASQRANKILGYLLGEINPESGDGKVIVRAAEAMLDDVRSLTPMDGADPDSSITDLEYQDYLADERQNPNGVPARFRLNEAGQKRWQYQRDYDLLRTMTEGRHVPPYGEALAPMNQLLGGVMGPFFTTISAGQHTAKQALDASAEALATGNVDPLLSINFPQNYNRAFQGQADNNYLFRQQLAGGALGRMRQGLYWYDRSKDAPATKDPLTGGIFPDRAASTPRGFSTIYNNYDNYTSQLSSPLELAVRNPSKLLEELNPFGKTSPLGDIRDVQSRANRDTPVAPTEELKKLIPAAADAANNREATDLAWSSVNYPRLVYGANKTFGTELDPTFLSPAAEIGVDLFGEIFSDPFSFSQLPTALAGKGVRGLFRHIGEEMAEESIPEYAAALAEYQGQVPPEELQPNVFAWATTGQKKSPFMQNPNGTQFQFPSQGSQRFTDDTAYKNALTQYRQSSQTFQDAVSDYAARFRQATPQLPRTLNYFRTE